LSNQNQALQQSVEAIVSKFISCPMEVVSGMESAEPSKLTTSSHTSQNAAVQVIVEELADRERRKHNIIVYNFPECADRQTDTVSFQTLLNVYHQTHSI